MPLYLIGEYFLHKTFNNLFSDLFKTFFIVYKIIFIFMDITRIFQTSSNDISDFFTQPGAGYYIPLYQREYAWDKDNIDQLMDNIYSGVSELITNQDTIHFLI